MEEQFEILAQYLKTKGGGREKKAKCCWPQCWGTAETRHLDVTHSNSSVESDQ